MCVCVRAAECGKDLGGDETTWCVKLYTYTTLTLHSLTHTHLLFCGSRYHYNTLLVLRSQSSLTHKMCGSVVAGAARLHARRMHTRRNQLRLHTKCKSLVIVRKVRLHVIHCRFGGRAIFNTTRAIHTQADKQNGAHTQNPRARGSMHFLFSVLRICVCVCLNASAQQRQCLC